MLYLAAPKRPNIDSQDVIIPSSAYRFRITNPWGTTFEAYYTPVRLQKSDAMRKDGLDVNNDEEVLEFLISLRAGGQLQKSCMSWTIGKTLPIFGPTVNPKVLQQLGTTPRSKSLILFAAGTGIAPMLQLIDFYSPKRMKDSPSIFLIWILKSPMHNYNEWIGLGEHVKVFKRKFRWAVLYSSKKPVVDVAALKGTTGTITESRRPRDKQPFYKRFQTRKLGDMQGKDPLDFSHRLSAEGALDELSLRGDPSDDEKNDMDEAPAVNDVFWRVHGNKCMSMKLNQELVSSLVSASEVESSQEGANFRGISEDSNKNGTKVHAGSNMVAYVCGSPGFDSCIRDWLLTGGFPKDQIVDFYSSPTVHV
ncbi:unnamed protein product [Cylindrotheca closterium]|uniref:Uncharacterized protein n=1 Tax=Cylindrotheca closterium TaxID=2856 RepID=A0AAD2CEQ0_9STRA|nr:unnamed protein product [Cylindrotheca closterium]